MTVITYKCPGCSGPLTWDGTKQKYICEYCLSSFTQEEIAKMNPEGKSQIPSGEQAFSEKNSTENKDTAFSKDSSSFESVHSAAETQEEKKKYTKINVYNCPSCGAQIAADDTTASTFCYYCHNPVVLSDRVSGEFDPDFIIPFAFDRKKALEIFKSWVSKHRYIPSDFYSDEQIEKFSGVYFPYWVYNCRINGNLTGRADVLKTWTDGVMQHTETSVYDISRSGKMPVESLSRIALKKASRVLCESVMPFENEGMKPFSAAYLQGYVSEMRDIEKDEIQSDVRNEVKTYAAEELKNAASEGYSSVEVTSIETNIEDESFRYALMPVWTLTYRGKDNKDYYFSINGQTGKTCGELPVDKGKLIRLFAVIFGTALLVFLAVFYFII